MYLFYTLLYTPKTQVNLHLYKIVHYILYINYNNNKGH